MTPAPLTLEPLLRDALPAAASGDQAAYGRIVSACQNSVTAIALAITRDVAASEDIAQEAFLRAWRRLGSLHNPDSFLPWLRQITRNLARDHLRARRRLAITGAGAELALGLAADTAPTPAERLLQTEQECIAAEIIATLPADSREVLLLYYREGQRSQQVADLLGLTDTVVRKRLSRARARVREELLKQLGEFARSSAPSAAFASAVLGLLAVAAPPMATATAAVLGAGSAMAGKGAIKVLGATLGAMVLALAAAIGSVWFGIRKPLREPLDRAERNALLAYGGFCTLLIVVFFFGITALARIPGWVPHVAFSLAYMGGIVWACGHWLPKILKRRQQRDLLHDPVGTAAKLRQAQFWKTVGLVGGLLMGSIGVVTGLIASGRWP